MDYFIDVSVRNDGKIAIFEMDSKSGKLQANDSAACDRSAPSTIDPEKNYLFAGRRNPENFGMSSLSINKNTGGLSPFGSIPHQGDPVLMATDRSNKFGLIPHIADGAQKAPNAIFQFMFDENTGRPTPNCPPKVTPKEPWD